MTTWQRKRIVGQGTKGRQELKLALKEAVVKKELKEMAKGKARSKKVKNKKTGRTKTVNYGQKGAKVKPGTSKGDSYCARSMGIKRDMIAKGGESAKKARDPNSPNNLSRKRWKCSGEKSKRSR